jgi:hypothetical protein
MQTMHVRCNTAAHIISHLSVNKYFVCLPANFSCGR